MSSSTRRFGIFLKLKAHFWLCWAVFFAVLLSSGLIFDKLFPPNLAKYFDQSTVLLDKEGALLALHLASDERIRLPIRINEVDPLFIRVLLTYEDKRFYRHPGIDPFSLTRALGQWLVHGRIISGGSTLTMQVARLLEPRPRQVRHKILEILRAMQLEYHYSKQTILEMYLSLAPYGGNLEGIRVATLSYFGKEPKNLSPAEAALLAVLPQSPTRLRPDLIPERVKCNLLAKRYRDKLITRMVQENIFSLKQGEEAKEEPVPTQRIAFPKLALHLFSDRTGSSIKLESSGKSTQLETTLNKTLQEQVEQHLKSELPFLEARQTIAAIIVDNQTREVRAYVGSADFFDEKRQGQVDMIKAIRSPGSTLKPFIYGLSFDQKCLHPETIVKDVPMSFSGYAPSNFRDQFHGEVSIREALQQSLNIPAVLALEKIGPGRFCDWLNLFDVNLKFRTSDNKPTLPIALGGVGIRFVDLMSLYVALGNQGEYAPLKVIKPFNNHSEKNNQQNQSLLDNLDKNASKSQKPCFLNRETAWHVTKILQETHAPSGFLDNCFTKQSAFAYKTGTSYGYRDAWAIGYTPDFTLGVWVGKPDGTPSINHTGRSTAAPILFKLLRFLPNTNQKQWSFSPPAGSLSLKSYELPRSLKILQRQDNDLDIAKNKAFRIQFPKDGCVVYVEKTKPIHCILSGGRPPYYAFINGQPLAESFLKSDIRWQPQTTGFMEFSVIDSAGQSDSISIELK